MLPGDAGMWVQLGHARREGGDSAGAETAYARALALDRWSADTHLHMGHALRALGKRERAAAAYARAARLAPGDGDARRELVSMGRRDLLPVPASDPAPAAALLAEGLGAVADWSATAGYARADWDRFCRDIPVRPPPGDLPRGDGLTVLVDATGRSPAALRDTLASLGDQSVRGWRAVVAAGVELRAHPVAGMVADDARLSWGTGTDAPRWLSLDAGTILHPEALAWMLFALERTGAGAAYCDGDRADLHALLGWTRRDPRLFGAFDADALTAGPPALVAGRGPAPDAPDGAALRRAALLGASPRVAHVPRVLATETGAAPPPVNPAPPPPTPGRIAAVIPTCDRPDLLARAVASLRACAADPGRVTVVVVDNGTVPPVVPDARVAAMPGPFNWSKACMAGAAAAPDAELLLFLNDDVEQLSRGWDDALAAALARADVGAVGARLLYPDMTVQHAGVVFGLGKGWPAHEGRGAGFDEPGPDRRWVSRRAVAAVTGAWLGTSRAWMARAGGLDPGLALAYNDLDYCLRVRAAGGTVLYEPAVEAIHLEGATRGRARSADGEAWDRGERRRLMTRWGRALADDPGLSPYWIRHARPLDGLREPPMRELLTQIDRTGAGRPWMPVTA